MERRSSLAPSRLPVVVVALALLLFGLPVAAFAARQFEVWVQGRVVDEAGDPVEGARITVTREGSRSRIRDETDAKGRYRVFLLDGRHTYLFRLEREGYRGAQRTLQPIETRSFDERHDPARRPEGATVEVEFTLRSVESVDRGTAVDPDDASPAERRRAAILLYNEGVAAAQNTLWARAEEKFHAALELDPELGKAHAGLAKVLFEQNRCEESLKAGETARELGPSDPEILHIRFHCLRRTGETEEAAEALDELAAEAPRLAAPSLLARAIRRYEAHDSEAAVAVLEQVLEAVPDHARAHYFLGLALLDLGRSEDARAPLERYLELAPDAYDADVVRDLLDELEPTRDTD